MERSALDGLAASGIAHERLRAMVAEEIKNCPICAARKPGEMMPNHRPSDRCESGKQPHCTCDVCF